MMTRIEARTLTYKDHGRTVSLYCKNTRRSITTEILAIELWPDEVIVWVPTDLDQKPYHLNPNQQILISGSRRD